MRMSSKFLKWLSCSDDDVDALARFGALDRAENHGEAQNVVATRRLRLGARANRRHEVPNDPEMAADAIVLGQRRRLDCRDRIEEAVAFAGREPFDANRVGPVPGERALRADETPDRFPRRRQPGRAPAAAIDECRAGFELENRGGRRALAVPRGRRVPLPAIDAEALSPVMQRKASKVWIAMSSSRT